MSFKKKKQILSKYLGSQGARPSRHPFFRALSYELVDHPSSKNSQMETFFPKVWG